MLLCLSLSFGCAQKKENKVKQKKPGKNQYELLLTNVWLKSKLPHFQKIILQSKAWLDTVEANPLELRRYGIKGKKKLVELFDAYLAIQKFLPQDAQKSIGQRLIDIAKITLRPGYHDMGHAAEEQFKEDATSYLRLGYLLERRGFNTGIYRQEILNILPRLNAQMSGRGVNQQLTFHWYYHYFNLEEPFPLMEAFKKGIIANRWDSEAMNETDVYGLTHEIFAIYGYGDNPDASLLSREDKTYLKEALKELISRYIRAQDPDLTAELLSCFCLLKMRGEPLFKTAVEYLLSSQNPDGSFGNYENLRLVYEERVKEGYYLHTTAVVLKALSLALNQ